MARNRLRMQTKGFEEMFEKLDKANADVKKITEEALKKSFDAVTPVIAIVVSVIPFHVLPPSTLYSIETSTFERTPPLSLVAVNAAFGVVSGGRVTFRLIV